VGCANARHTDVKPENATSFYKSGTVINAREALANEEQKAVIKSVDEFNNAEEEKKKAADEAPREVIKNKDGLTRCGNMGCNGVYDPELA
jgi:hypothetical protein